MKLLHKKLTEVTLNKQELADLIGKALNDSRKELGIADGYYGFKYDIDVNRKDDEIHLILYPDPQGAVKKLEETRQLLWKIQRDNSDKDIEKPVLRIDALLRKEQDKYNLTPDTGEGKK